MMKMLFLGVVCAALPITMSVVAETRFESGPQQTVLVELYTSEGCSSCPPAEAWMSRLQGDPGLWKKFVPIAFHVDYWDRLGWRDRFSSRNWTERQSRYAALWQSESVYTQVAAAWALAHIDENKAGVAKKVLPLLIETLNSGVPLLRAEAVNTLAALGPAAKSALPALKKLADDPDPRVAQAVAVALEQIGNKPKK